MSSDLERLLHGTAVAPLEPIDVEAVVARAGQHRRRQRVGASLAAAAFGLAIATGISMVVETPDPVPIVTVPQPPERVDTEPTVPAVEAPPSDGLPEDGPVDLGAGIGSPSVRPADGEGAAALPPAGGRAGTTNSAPAAQGEMGTTTWTFASGADDWRVRRGLSTGDGVQNDPGSWAWRGPEGDGSGRLVAFVTGVQPNGPYGGGGPSGNRTSVTSPDLPIPAGAVRATVEVRYRFERDESIGAGADLTVWVDADPRAPQTSNFRTESTTLAPADAWRHVSIDIDLRAATVLDVELARFHSSDVDRVECFGEERPRACDFGLEIDEVTVRFLAE